MVTIATIVIIMVFYLKSRLQYSGGRGDMGDLAFSLWHSCCFFSSSFFSNSLNASLWLFFKCLHRLYGAIVVSKFNNTLDTRDISFWCTHFSGGVQILGYKFWGTNLSCWCINFRERLLIQGGGHKLPGGVQISQRGTHLFVSKFISCWCTCFPGGVLIWGV